MSNSSKRVAVITGAAAGLGLATAHLLAKKNHDVVLIDVREDALQSAAAEFTNIPVRVETLLADLAKVSECERVIAESIHRMGRLDILINCAAILARRELQDVTAESFDAIYNVNARAPFFLMRAAIPDMAKRNWGRIVNICSVGIYVGGAKMTSAVYESTKGSLAIFTKMYAKHGAPNNILVNSVCPGLMRTRMITAETPPEVVQKLCDGIPLRRMAEPAEVGQLVAWLCSDENSYATGATFDCTGGWGMH